MVARGLSSLNNVGGPPETTPRTPPQKTAGEHRTIPAPRDSSASVDRQLLETNSANTYARLMPDDR